MCPQCGFFLQKSVLSVADGNIYANTRQDYELCPNDGNAMRPITYKEAYEDGCKMQRELLDRAAKAESTNTVSNGRRLKIMLLTFMAAFLAGLLNNYEQHREVVRLRLENANLRITLYLQQEPASPVCTNKFVSYRNGAER